MYLLNLRKSATQVELDQFFKVLRSKNQAVQFITKSAFFQARKYISHSALVALNIVLIQNFYQLFNHYHTWHGLRLCAIDGSQIRLPDEPDITREFGFHTGQAEQADCPMALVSVFYDVLNGLAIDAGIHPTRASERACAALHLQHAAKNDLVLYDRGYNAFWLYALHKQRNIAFCMRAKINRGLPFKRFVESHQPQAVVTFYPNPASLLQCQEKGLPITSITLRLVRVDLGDEVEVLITNLLDHEKFDVKLFKDLYHRRWGIEEQYKRLKQWTEIENFSGKSAHSIRQDFHAKIVATNLTALAVLAAQEQVTKATRTHQREYKVNFAQALSKMKHTLVMLLQQNRVQMRLLLAQLFRHIAQTKERVRGGRSYPRSRSAMRNNLYFNCYKRSL